jgi:diguanylate cyclase (GGDEF)-like protein
MMRWHWGVPEMNFGTRTGVSLGVTLLAVAIGMAGLIYKINLNAIERLLTADAAATSTSAAHYFEKYLPEREGILAGVPPSETTKAFIARSLVDKGVTRFKLYDAAGTFILDSNLLQDGVSAPGHSGTTDDRKLGDAIGDLNESAATVMASRKPNVSFDDSDVNAGLVAETYVPIIHDDKVIGAAEVYTDQTRLAARYRTTFAWTTFLIALLAAGGFAIPALGFLWRNRQKQVADDNVRFMAEHDVLTSLYNRKSFSVAAAQSLNTTLDDGKVALFHFIDIDRFKEINDTRGHAIGDEVLQAVARRLESTLREGDLVARLGGDELVVAQFGFTLNEQIHTATTRLSAIFAEPFRGTGAALTVTASIGTAVAPVHGRSVETLLNNADTAVYVVKGRGRNGQCYYDEHFDEENRKRLHLEDVIRRATAARAFEVHYQPLIRIHETDIKGFEALLRLRDDNGEAISPATFIPIAENMGIIDEIGAWVLTEACATAATWPSHLQISVNLSVAQFRSRNVVKDVRSALTFSGLAPHRLLLEITESLLLTDADGILAQLTELKSMGVAIVMDDFGTGYSSLGYMLRFPFDRIKIDRSFVQELGRADSTAGTVIETIISLGHTLKMDVTAEGVETQAQANALRAMHCDDAQGYFYGRPMPKQDIAALLTRDLARLMAQADMPETISVAS